MKPLANYRLLLAVVCTVIGMTTASVDGRDRVALVGARVLMPDGSLVDDKVVLVKDGKVEGVTSPGDVPDSIERQTLPTGSVLAPGSTALLSEIGCRGQLLALAKAVDPSPDAADAVDVHHGDLRHALESGLTSAMACPSPANVVCGRSVTYRTTPREGKLDVLHRGSMIFSLGVQVLRADREPTSRSGAARLLRECLTDAKDAKPGTDLARIADFLAGRARGLVFANEERDVRNAMRIFGDAGRIPDLVYTPKHRDEAQARRLAAGLAAADVAVVMGPFDANTPESTLRAAGLFAGEGVRVAFGCGAPQRDPVAARWSAALAVRHGMNADAARRALTRVPAAVAGSSQRVGTIERGRDADLVVYSGDPLRLDSRVVAVYVRGERVHYDPETGAGE